jgi:hypothetical protein
MTLDTILHHLETSGAVMTLGAIPHRLEGPSLGTSQIMIRAMVHSG